MQVLQAIILGLVQGLTEFIPVSSSGHLILVGNWLEFSYSGLAFDTVLDVGTLAALLIFFWRDFWNIGHDLVLGGPGRRLAWYIALATVPAVIGGLLIERAAETVLRSDVIVAINLIWVAVLMLLADHSAEMIKKIEEIKLGQAMIVGLVQCLALVPGVSRSGSTIVAGRFLKLDRVTATRFSFLLSAPIILGATLKQGLKASTVIEIAAAPGLYLAGILAAAASGYFAIKFLIGYLSRHGLSLFAYYRLAVGVVVLAVSLR